MVFLDLSQFGQRFHGCHLIGVQFGECFSKLGLLNIKKIHLVSRIRTHITLLEWFMENKLFQNLRCPGNDFSRQTCHLSHMDTITFVARPWLDLPQKYDLVAGLFHRNVKV